MIKDKRFGGFKLDYDDFVELMGNTNTYDDDIKELNMMMMELNTGLVKQDKYLKSIKNFIDKLYIYAQESVRMRHEVRIPSWKK